MPEDQRPKAIAIMGPTASGKSALALVLARQWNGEVISVDSAQVYRGLEIGSAKPNAVIRAQIPHHLINICEPWQVFSAAQFVEHATAALSDICARGRLPILVGGTGLYFRALFQGLATLPGANPSVRAELTRQAQIHGWPALHQRLADIDPATAQRIHPTDKQRIQRALEVFYVTGQPLSDWLTAQPLTRLPVRLLKVAVTARVRSQLYQQIAQRFDTMLQQGLLDEVCALRRLPALQQIADPLQLPAIRAVGYRQAWQYLEGAYDRSMFRQRSIQATKQLAKRQLTWLRSELDVRWFDPICDRLKIFSAIQIFIRGHPRVEDELNV